MTAPIQTRKEYSPVEIDEALRVLVFYGGNAVRASKDTGVPDRTLRQWRNETHRDLYQDIAEREGPKLEAIAAAQAREVLLRASAVEHRILDRLDTEEELSTKETTELAGALQRVTTAKGINTTKVLELTGRPTQVVQHLNPRDTMLALGRELGVVFEGTAEEAPAELAPTGPIP